MPTAPPTEIDVPVQNLKDETSTDELLNSKNQSLNELLGQVVHHNPNNRREAYAGLQELFDKHPGLFSREIATILPRIVEGMIDEEPSVRRSLCTLLSQNLWQLSTAKMFPFGGLLCTYIITAMTHLSVRIRLDALQFLRVLLSIHPMLLLSQAARMLPNYVQLLTDRNSSAAAKVTLMQSLSAASSAIGKTLPSASTDIAKAQRSAGSQRREHQREQGAVALGLEVARGSGAPVSLQAAFTEELDAEPEDDLDYGVQALDLAPPHYLVRVLQSAQKGDSTTSSSHLPPGLAILARSKVLSMFMHISSLNRSHHGEETAFSFLRRSTQNNVALLSALGFAGGSAASVVSAEPIQATLATLAILLVVNQPPSADRALDSLVLSLLLEDECVPVALKPKPIANLLFSAQHPRSEYDLVGDFIHAALEAEWNAAGSTENEDHDTTDVLSASFSTTAGGSSVLKDCVHDLLGSLATSAPTCVSIAELQSQQHHIRKYGVPADALQVRSSSQAAVKPSKDESDPTFQYLLQMMSLRDSASASATVGAEAATAGMATSISTAGASAHELLRKGSVAVASQIKMLVPSFVSSLIDCWVEYFPTQLAGLCGGASGRGIMASVSSSQAANLGSTTLLEPKQLSARMHTLAFIASNLLSLAHYALANRTKSCSSLVPEVLFEPYLSKLNAHVFKYFPLATLATHDVKIVSQINISLAQLISLIITTVVQRARAITTLKPASAAQDSVNVVEVGKKRGSDSISKDQRKNHKKVRKDVGGDSASPLLDPFGEIDGMATEWLTRLLNYIHSSINHLLEHEKKVQAKVDGTRVLKQAPSSQTVSAAEEHKTEHDEDEDDEDGTDEDSNGDENEDDDYDGEDQEEAGGEEKNVADDESDEEMEMKRATKIDIAVKSLSEAGVMGSAPLHDLIRIIWLILPALEESQHEWLLSTFTTFYISCAFPVRTMSSTQALIDNGALDWKTFERVAGTGRKEKGRMLLLTHYRSKVACLPLIAALLHRWNTMIGPAERTLVVNSPSGLPWIYTKFAQEAWIPSLFPILQAFGPYSPIVARLITRLLQHCVVTFSPRIRHVFSPEQGAFPVVSTPQFEGAILLSNSLVERKTDIAPSDRYFQAGGYALDRMACSSGEILHLMTIAGAVDPTIQSEFPPPTAMDWDALLPELVRSYVSPVSASDIDQRLVKGSKLLKPNVFSHSVMRPGPVFYMVSQLAFGKFAPLSQHPLQLMARSNVSLMIALGCYLSRLDDDFIQALRFLAKFNATPPVPEYFSLTEGVGMTAQQKRRATMGSRWFVPSRYLPTHLLPSQRELWTRTVLPFLASADQSALARTKVLEILLDSCLATSQLVCLPEFKPSSRAVVLPKLPLPDQEILQLLFPTIASKHPKLLELIRTPFSYSDVELVALKAEYHSSQQIIQSCMLGFATQTRAVIRALSRFTTDEPLNKRANSILLALRPRLTQLLSSSLADLAELVQKVLLAFSTGGHVSLDIPQSEIVKRDASLDSHLGHAQSVLAFYQLPQALCLQPSMINMGRLVYLIDSIHALTGQDPDATDSLANAWHTDASLIKTIQLAISVWLPLVHRFYNSTSEEEHVKACLNAGRKCVIGSKITDSQKQFKASRDVEVDGQPSRLAASPRLPDMLGTLSDVQGEDAQSAMRAAQGLQELALAFSANESGKQRQGASRTRLVVNYCEDEQEGNESITPVQLPTYAERHFLITTSPQLRAASNAPVDLVMRDTIDIVRRFGIAPGQPESTFSAIRLLCTVPNMLTGYVSLLRARIIAMIRQTSSGLNATNASASSGFPTTSSLNDLVVHLVTLIEIRMARPSLVAPKCRELLLNIHEELVSHYNKLLGSEGTESHSLSVLQGGTLSRFTSALKVLYPDARW